jgi:micrococcal nuclease
MAWQKTKALVTEVYDGDTITVDFLAWQIKRDIKIIGFNPFHIDLKIYSKNQKIRLHGIDTPEVRGKEKIEGFIVRNILRDKILGKEIEISLKDKKGKFGRSLGVVFLDKENINEFLLKNGYAKEANY